MVKETYKVKSIKKELCKEWLLYKHYLKRKTSFTYCFGLFKKNQLVGIITFGNAITLTMKKSLFGEKYMGLVYELNRLCTNDNLDKNANSFFISQSFKLLPSPMIIVSYADKSIGHNGYVYQATNFMFTGESHTQLDWKVKGKENLHTRSLIDEFSFEKNRVEKLKEKYGNKLYQVKRPPKYRYVYIIANKNQKKQIMNHKRFNILKYPKGQNTNYDASHKITIQTELF
jgi:hypothetical protein